MRDWLFLHATLTTATYSVSPCHSNDPAQVRTASTCKQASTCATTCRSHGCGDCRRQRASAPWWPCWQAAPARWRDAPCRTPPGSSLTSQTRYDSVSGPCLAEHQPCMNAQISSARLFSRAACEQMLEAGLRLRSQQEPEHLCVVNSHALGGCASKCPCGKGCGNFFPGQDRGRHCFLQPHRAHHMLGSRVTPSALLVQACAGCSAGAQLCQEGVHGVSDPPRPRDPHARGQCLLHGACSAGGRYQGGPGCRCAHMPPA